MWGALVWGAKVLGFSWARGDRGGNIRRLIWFLGARRGPKETGD